MVRHTAPEKKELRREVKKVVAELVAHGGVHTVLDPSTCGPGIQHHPSGNVLFGAKPPRQTKRLLRPLGVNDDRQLPFRRGECGVLELCQLIENYSRPGELVADLRMGTGSFGLAALRTGMHPHPST